MSQINYKISIINELLLSQNHIRGLAKSLSTNQTTIARKVKELIKENIVDFRLEGKNKIVFMKKSLEAKQYAYLAENAKMFDLLEKHPELRQIIEVIKKNNKISLAILFGSYAKGKVRAESDIDIYIDTTDSRLKDEIESLDTRLSVKIGRYNNESLLIKEIELSHVILKGVEQYYEKNRFFE